MQSYALTLDRFIDHAAKWHGAVEVVTGGVDGGRVTYAALRGRAKRVSRALTRLGMTRGDRIAILAWNTADHMALWYGSMGAGIVCHTLNPRLTLAQVAAITAQADGRVLAYGTGLRELAVSIAACCPRIGHLIALDGEEPGLALGIPSWSLDGLVDEAIGDVAWGCFEEDSEAGICFTSGTTGAPKGVIYTHRSNYLHTLRLLQAGAMGLTGDDRVLAAVPMFHANGWGLPFAAPAVGAGLVLPGRDTGGEALARLVVDECVTVAAGVPTVWLGLADHLAETGGTLPTLRRLYLGGAPLPQAAQRRLEETLGCSVHVSWGMTELSPLGTVAAHGTQLTPSGSSGTVPLGLDLRVVDPDGAPLAQQRGCEGRLQALGQSVVERYLGETELATDEEGWFDTGDLAVISDAGQVSITGRAKDLIKSGGEWINPAEIEAAAGAVPGIALAAGMARADERWGERPVLVVEQAPGAAVSDAELLAALRTQVARWWLPDAIHRVDAMPTAATGKIDKGRLRDLFGVPAEVALQAVTDD